MPTCPENSTAIPRPNARRAERHAGEGIANEIERLQIAILNRTSLISRLSYQDVARAEARLAAAQADVQVARSLMLPRLTLKANVAVGAEHLADLFANRSYDLGGALLAPIFNAGAPRAGYQASQARQQELLENYRKALLDAFGDVDRHLNDGAGLDRQLHWQAQTLDRAQQAFGLAKIRYRAGAHTLLTLLDAQRNLYQAQDDTITLRLQRLKASVALFKALGVGGKVLLKAPLRSANPKAVESTNGRSSDIALRAQLFTATSQTFKDVGHRPIKRHYAKEA